MKYFNIFMNLKKVITTETFTTIFIIDSSNFGLFCFFNFSSYIYIYIYIACFKKFNIIFEM